MPNSWERQSGTGLKRQAGVAVADALVRGAAGPVVPLSPTQRQALVSAEQLARRLDGWFIDPLVGLFLPGLGDVVGVLLGMIPVIIAWRAEAPPRLLLAMLLNLTIDLLAGYLPLVGDLLDFLVRANQRNAALLASWHGESSGEQAMAPFKSASPLAPRWVGLALLGLLSLLFMLSAFAIYGAYTLLTHF
ncbi:MAG: DUF4112 domain-containing protein [Myxococcota bacterium]